MREKVFVKFDLADRELAVLLNHLEPISEEMLGKKPSEEAWSVKENLYHLIKAEHMAHRYLEKKLSKPVEIEAAGWKSSLRLAKLRLAFSSPFKVKAPAIVRPDDMPEMSFPEMKNQWLQQRKSLREYLITIPDEIYHKAVFNHAVVGRLSLWGMVDFFQHHLRRHRGQIHRTLNQVNKL